MTARPLQTPAAIPRSRRGAPAAIPGGCAGKPGPLTAPDGGGPGAGAGRLPAPKLPGSLPVQTPSRQALTPPGPADEGAAEARRDAPRRRPAGLAAASPAGSATDPGEAASADPAGTSAIAAAMPEDRGPDSLEAHLRRLMKDLGLWGYHPRRSEKSEKGWPDWVIIGSRILHRELKTERGKVTDEQQQVGIRIASAGGDWAVWRPSDLLSGRIARELTAISCLSPVVRRARTARPGGA